MYLSHPVRRLRTDPHPEEDVVLVVELGSLSADDLRDAVADLNGEVEAELRFDSYRLRLPQTAVDQFCELDGLKTVETENAVGYGGDSGEDME
ncbi:hypothetical protein [Halorarum halobium]|uniref:hypothetical protein n=1 Tax=Halorarum halobium TaxID=3075121 RepID=UPI0028A6E809|nr:hypothetical protein [Halobaculum sp. XH14]